MKKWFKRRWAGVREYDKAAATSVPIAPGIDRDAARLAASRILERDKDFTLDGISVKDLVEDGRS